MLFKSLGSVFFFFGGGGGGGVKIKNKNNTFIQQGHITMNKSDSKNFIMLQKLSVSVKCCFFNFIFIKDFKKVYTTVFSTNIIINIK